MFAAWTMRHSPMMSAFASASWVRKLKARSSWRQHRSNCKPAVGISIAHVDL